MIRLNPLSLRLIRKLKNLIKILAQVTCAVSLSAVLLRQAGAWSPGTSQPKAVQGFTVNTTNRVDVLSFYNTIYTASEGYQDRIQWTGNVSLGIAGTTSEVFKGDVQRRINFFRAMAGVPANVTLSDVNNAKCQAAALMMSANANLSHSPPPSWKFYTAAGAEAAGSSNLYLGLYGPDAISGYIQDPGEDNSAVGHRRWVLYPPTQKMGTGDIVNFNNYNSANALWVFDGYHPSPTLRDGFVAWPSPGYVPYNLVYSRWSFSLKDANLASAKISVTRNGKSVGTRVESRVQGYGDNSIVWSLADTPADGTGYHPKPEGDVLYSVKIKGVIVAGKNSDFSYLVRVFDPDKLGQSVSVIGPDNASTQGQRYSFTTIEQADAYSLSVATGSNTGWLEGAEGVTNIINATDASYSLAQNEVVRSGTQAFHLALAGFADESFEINRNIVPSANSLVTFYEQLRLLTTENRASLEVTDDGGLTWAELWGRNGTETAESVFNAHSISLAAYAGRPVRLRFILRPNNFSYYSATTNFGIILDDISVTDAMELVNPTTTQFHTALPFTLDSTLVPGGVVAGGRYYLQIRPKVGTRWYGYGPLKVVTGSDTVPIPITYQVTLRASGKKGRVTGAGLYAEGTRLTITAKAKPGKKFVSWTEGKKVISRKPTYKFILNASRTLVANFK